MKGYTMDEQTTTNAPVDDGGSTIHGIPVDDQGQAIPDKEPQPEQPESAEAVSEPVEPSQEAPKEEEPAKADNSSVEWLKKKGIDPTSPEAIEKVAEMARNAEKAMHEKAQKASELEKTVQTTAEDIPVDATQSEIDSARVRNIELRQQLLDWRLANPDKREAEAKMTELLAQKPNLKELVRAGYLDFNELHAIAKGSDAGHDDTVKSQGKREALETLAQKQQAAVPQGNAVNPSGTNSASKITPQNVDQLVKQNDLEWFKAHQAEINAAMAG